MTPEPRLRIRWDARDKSFDRVLTSTRLGNVLAVARVERFGDLEGRTREELLRLRGMGRKALQELEQLLVWHGGPDGRTRAWRARARALMMTMAKKHVGVPREAVAWIRKVFASVNKDVSSLLSVNPNHHEPELDMALIGGLNHAPPVAHPAGWTVYIQTHFLGGRRHFYNWEVADIGFLVIFRDRGKILRIKVGLLQSKRLYPTEEKQLPEHVDRFRVGFATLVAEADAFRALVSGRSFTFSRESQYLAISKGDDQARALHQYEKMSGIPVYYLFYNPSTIPLTATVPAVRLVPPKEPKAGCRVVPAQVVAAAIQTQPGGYHPSFGDVAGLPAPFRGPHRGGWRLEHFAADLLVGCRQGHVASDTTDHVLEALFYRRSGPIAAAIAVTVDAPPDTELVLPDVPPPVWRDE